MALKVLNSKNEVLALKNEIRVLTQIRSPHCVQLLGWEDLSLGPCLVLEYLDGVSLLDLAVFSPLSESLVNEIIAQIQEGLNDLAHYNVWHGDLSPRNIFITKQGVVKLLDFGFSGKHSSKDVYGTPQFLAPEIWLAQKSSLGSDLFSLGLLREDLLNSSLVLDKAHVYWQQRALDSIGKNSLLAADPSNRNFLQLESQKQHREALACAAQKAFDYKHSVKHTEKIVNLRAVHKSSVNLLKWRPVGLGVLVFFIFHQLQPANQPLNRIQQKIIQHTFKLDVRSNSWASIVVIKKGERAQARRAYTPYSFKNLSEGEYEVHFRSSKKTGMIPVSLLKNRRLLLE